MTARSSVARARCGRASDRSDSFELKGSTNSGAEVRMTFIAARSGDPAAGNRVTGNVGADRRWDSDAD